MSTKKEQNLKRLLRANREVPITTVKLKKMGISPFLARRYKESGWIESIGFGAYKFPGFDISIEGLLHCLQFDLMLNLHASAKTALEMAGIRHYYREKERMYLFIEGKSNVPLWVKNYHNYAKIIRSSKWNQKKFLHNPGTKEYDFFIATKELAIFEQIELINRGENFEETALLFELLTSLNPELINELLKEASLKTKRIFAFLADSYNHPWVKDINKELLDSGQSEISIEKGGKYVKDYHLVIPGNFNV
ncbi:MAG: type IV toxin-antitoxin system AbiEi family antitoxin domain-containing protein [Candidatus Aminicenantes bacterium]